MSLHFSVAAKPNCKSLDIFSQNSYVVNGPSPICSQDILFKPNEYIYTGQTDGIDSQMKSNITGWYFITISSNSCIVKS